MALFSRDIILLDEEKKDVEYMIEILGLNCHYYERKKQLESFKLKQECGYDVNPHEYLTAWDMSLKKNFE